MSEQLRESLSAAMDDEADAFELRRMLDEAQGDEALREQWHRYHLVRDVLRDQMQADHPRQLRSNTWQALLEAPDEAEDLDDYSLSLLVSEQAEAKSSPTRSTWMGRLAGGAVAAAVAALVVINGGVFEQSNDASFVAGAPDAVRLAPVNIAPVMYEQATPRDHQRQHGLMLRHIQSRAMNQPGVAAFAKMATFRNPMLPEHKQDTQTLPRQERPPGR